MRVWSLRRARVSHHLVSNQLVLALARLERIACGRVDTASDTWKTELRDLWEKIRVEIIELEARVLEEMSPRLFFDEPPLCHCMDDTKEWLARLVHEIWLTRSGVVACRSELLAAREEVHVVLNRLFLDEIEIYCCEFLDCIYAARVAAMRLSTALASMPKTPFP